MLHPGLQKLADLLRLQGYGWDGRISLSFSAAEAAEALEAIQWHSDVIDLHVDSFRRLRDAGKARTQTP